MKVAAYNVMSKKNIITGLLILSFIVVVAGIIVPHRSKKAEFRTVKVERGELVSTVSGTGTLSAVVTVQVGTQVSGTIQKLFVDFNAPVKAGQTIAQIDPALLMQKSRRLWAATITHWQLSIGPKKT